MQKKKKKKSFSPSGKATLETQAGKA